TTIEGEKVTIENYYNGIFPWQSSFEISFQSKYHLIDAWMLP
ncbi:Uncharacterized protein APZ42_008160, partial [Daphnia magna]